MGESEHEMKKQEGSEPREEVRLSEDVSTSAGIAQRSDYRAEEIGREVRRVLRLPVGKGAKWRASVGECGAVLDAQWRQDLAEDPNASAVYNEESTKSPGFKELLLAARARPKRPWPYCLGASLRLGGFQIQTAYMRPTSQDRLPPPQPWSMVNRAGMDEDGDKAPRRNQTSRLHREKTLSCIVRRSELKHDSSLTLLTNEVEIRPQDYPWSSTGDSEALLAVQILGRMQGLRSLSTAKWTLVHSGQPKESPEFVKRCHRMAVYCYQLPVNLLSKFDSFKMPTYSSRSTTFSNSTSVELEIGIQSPDTVQGTGNWAPM
ncbi:hypothetical protein C8F04DRAFT_1172974 [Mycena alexandri]|uniref:Uncharacterized protein n=1 Tax=Mycena alexandri TaxID=1745969 RepID=A0AAD6WQV6_9AGAR|nr:hypothetical protein C8F04DRAFT_1195195 [Mycena alexandri]KAJ7046003.1 hypothetical protein C8F04DRAFT_1172974 [Mycena alexandri]